MRVLGCFFLLLAAMVHAETVAVRLEPLPPLVVDEDTGLTIELLRAVEAVSDFRFAIEVVPYSRAKYQLRNGQASLIGHTPVGFESPDFYHYAQDLDWQVATGADLFARDPAMLALENTEDIYIGTPLGNAAFFAELTGVPIQRFVEASLPNLVQMLAHGRVQVVVFEAVSARRAIRDAGLSGVHFRHLADVHAGLAVRRDDAGSELRRRLDAAIDKVDLEAIFGDYLEEAASGEAGVVLLP